MSYLVLARKWRPQSFEDIAGQSHITRTLQNAIRSSRIAHAYLFTGVRGVGKTTAARVLAKALNCAKGPTPTPCNECVQCNEITRGHCLDVLEIDGASNRGIDEIRQIIENVRYQPAQGRFKIYVIDEVHQVTKDAFNALLKTLEEPPPSVKFILATTEPHRLPETILSRCQRFDFRRISLREIIQRLGEIAAREGLKVREGALMSLAREADGSMRDAQSLLEQVLSCAATGEQPEVDEAFVEELLGLTGRQTLFEISRAVIAGDGKGCLQLLGQAAQTGRDLTRLSKDLVEHFRNLMVARLCAEKRVDRPAETEMILDLPDQEILELGSQAAAVSLDTLLDYFDVMAAGDEEVARAANPRFALEAVLIRLSTLPKTLPVAELIERLLQLERRVIGDGQSASGESAAPPRSDLAGAEDAQSRAEGAPGASKDEVWRNFVSFIGKEKKLLASHLEFGNAITVPPEALTIGIAERHHLSYLQDAENMALLKSFARRFFASDVAVHLQAQASGKRTESTASSEPAGGMVKEALRIFGGSIKGVRKENA